MKHNYKNIIFVMKYIENGQAAAAITYRITQGTVPGG